MGVIRISVAAIVLLLLTSVAAFGHGDAGIYATMAEAQVSNKDRTDRVEVENLNQQATELAGKGQYEAAVALAEKELAIAKQSSYPPTISGVGVNLCNLAAYCFKQEKYAQAESLYRSVQKLYEEKVATGDPIIAIAINPAIASVVNNLGTIQERLGDLAQAELYYKKSLELNEKALGQNSPAVAAGLKNLAELYRFNHRDNEADELEKRAAAVEAVIAAKQAELQRSLVSQ